MKKGDLVVLSAYGNKLKCLQDFRGDIGIVIGHNIVMWSSRPNFTCLVNDRDIKRAK
jgi:hypothetical protein